MTNNIFDFATGELSQDALICWCLNWFNDRSRPRLHEMALNILRRLVGDIPVEQVDIFRQFNQRVKMEDGKSIAVKVDVFVIVNRTVGVIIEDKTFSAVHGNQIYRYTTGIRRMLANDGGKLWIGGTPYALLPDRLITVFWKTGFHYDYDKAVTADIALDGDNVLELLSPYRGESDILDDYLRYLENLLAWYQEHEDFTLPHRTENGELYDWWCNLSCNAYPQYRLMRTIFPEERWVRQPDIKDALYQVEDGTSYGRPWTQMIVGYGSVSGSGSAYKLFWRIDTDSAGPYLSLRFYEWGLDKKSGTAMARHRETYDAMKSGMAALVRAGTEPLRLSWEEVDPGYRGNSMEADFFHLRLSSYLASWDAGGEKLAGTIRALNDQFLKRLSEGAEGNGT